MRAVFKLKKMQKNSITNKITPCCNLPFSVVYWWVKNLTLNSEADRDFIISKISQSGTISIEAWKVLAKSATLETDASFTKAELFSWFDCGNQPSCEKLKIIIEGLKIGNYDPIDEYGVGWTEVTVFELDGDRSLKKIVEYVGGVGALPIELSGRIGKYYGNGIITDDKSLAVDFKGNPNLNYFAVDTVLDSFVHPPETEWVEFEMPFAPDLMNSYYNLGFIQEVKIDSFSGVFNVSSIAGFNKIKVEGKFNDANVIYIAKLNETLGIYNVALSGVNEEYSHEIEIESNIEQILYTREEGMRFFKGKDVVSNEPKKDAVLKAIKRNEISDMKSAQIVAEEKLAKINFITEDYLPKAKGTKINGIFEININGRSFEKFGKLEVQGSSSAVYPKKNWTLELFNNEERNDSFKLKIGEWAYHSEFVFKSNYIDATHSRNLVSNQIWEDIVQSRKYYPKRENEKIYNSVSGSIKDRFDSGALCHVDGFPCELFVNGKFYGLGSFNLGKKRENYDLDKNNQNHIQLQAETHAVLESFVPIEWDLRNPSSPTESTVTKINNWFASNNLSGASFKLNFPINHDLKNSIDYFLLAEFIMATDAFDKNFIITAWDGVKFFFLPYDLDTCFGLSWEGLSIDSPTAVSITNVLFWYKFKEAFLPEIKERYAELKNLNILTEDNVYKKFKHFAKIIGIEKYQEDFSKWTQIPSNNLNVTTPYGTGGVYTSVGQIMEWTKNRIVWLDSQYL